MHKLAWFAVVAGISASCGGPSGGTVTPRHTEGADVVVHKDGAPKNNGVSALTKVFRLRHAVDGRCLALNGKNRAVTRRCRNDPAQSFRAEAHTSFYRLRHQASDLCLRQLESTTGTSIDAVPCDDQDVKQLYAITAKHKAWHIAGSASESCLHSQSSEEAAVTVQGCGEDQALDYQLDIATGYRPTLPKTSPIHSVQIFDLDDDLAKRDNASRDAYLLAVVIQGLVNRLDGDKIYFLHTPTIASWAQPKPTLKPWSAEQAWLDDGLIPTAHVHPTLDRSKSYPVLSYLLKHYHSVIKGQVLVPTLDAYASDGAMAYALTACASLDAIPVSSTTAVHVQQAGLQLALLDDARNFTSNALAFDLSYQRYFRATTSRAFIGTFAGHPAGRELDFASMADYLVANRAFVYALDASQALEEQRLRKLYSAANYPVGTPTLGLPYSAAADSAIPAELGYPVDVATMPNLSATSGFASEPLQVPGRARSFPTGVAPEGVYLAFYVTGGEAWRTSADQHYHYWMHSAQSSLKPIGWSINVQLMDVFPTLLHRLATANHRGSYELIAASWQSALIGGPGLNAFTQRYLGYVGQIGSGNVFRMVHLDQVSGSAAEVAAEGVVEGADFTSLLADIPDARTLDSLSVFGQREAVRVPLVGGTAGPTSAETLYQSILSAISSASSTSAPVFAVIAVGSNNTFDVPLGIEQALARIKAGTVLHGRPLTVLAPSDLIATYRVAQGPANSPSVPVP